MTSLYERLGGTEGIITIASDLVDIHLKNPRISPRYAASDVAKVKHAVATFFISGTGGLAYMKVRICCPRTKA